MPLWARSAAPAAASLFHLPNLIFDEEILYQKLTEQFARWNAQRGIVVSL